MDAARGDAVALTQALTRFDSRNPTLAPVAPGEAPIATALGEILRGWGFDVALVDSGGNRPNLIARLGPKTGRALMFAGHLDTVGVEGMTHPPFDAVIEGDRLYGRGAADMKAGIAAMCCAALAAFDESRGSSRQIIIAAVADEEYESLGMRSLLASGVTAECAILTEPTRLAICPAHRGFVWMEIEFLGRAAHGSRYDIGIDAIRHAGLFLSELDELDNGPLQSTTQKLLGRGSVHASTISGGIGMSTYPDRCVLRVERRTIPGEAADTAMREVHSMLDRIRTRRPDLSANVSLISAQAPSDVATDAPLVQMLERALLKSALPVSI